MLDPKKVVFLTDRWGDPLENVQLTKADLEAIERLKTLMWDECSFVVRHGDQHGIMLEMEFEDGYAPSEEQKIAWASLAPPFCSFVVVKGDDDIPVFNDRWALWGFFPERFASAERLDKYGTMMLDGTYAKEKVNA